MTKVMEWLGLLAFIVASWWGTLRQNPGGVATTYPNFVLFWPLGLAVMFALYAAFVVIYRTLTFNDCPEAADELQKQIKEAKADLKKKGLKF